MKSDGEENSDMRPSGQAQIDSYDEGKETSTTPRSKTPSRYVQKEHPQSQILGDQRHGVQTRRKLVGSSSCANIPLLSQIEPKNLSQASEDKFWVRAMNE